MAVDMFIRIGALKGESRDKQGHKEEIDVLSYSFGMTQQGYAHTGGGMGAGKVNVHDVSITKYVDKCSPDLMLHCCNGKHFPDAVLVVRKAGEKPLEYLKYTMTDVIITSVTSGGAGGGDNVTENVSLNFAKIKVEYKEQTATGGVGATPSMTWDIAGGIKE